MKRILTSLVLVASAYSFAQVSISGADDHTPKATLDVEAIQGKTNGILVPRVTKDVADNMPSPQGSAKIENSTLIYITGSVSGQATKYATEVDAEGFYYFKDDKWVKLGGGASSSSIELGTVKVTGVIQPIPVPIAKESINDNTFVVLATQSGENTVELPNPAGGNKGRVLSVNNQSGNDITFTGKWQPVGMTKLAGGAGHMLISDGAHWYVIGGIY